MQAIAQDRYGNLGDVLKLEEVKAPAPGKGEMLVRIRAASVNQQDCHNVTGTPYVMRATGHGLMRPSPRIRGADAAGVVEAVGAGVTRFAPGDEVLGWCDGSFAEYGSAPENQWVPKPERTSFGKASCIGVAALRSPRSGPFVASVRSAKARGCS